ncbi:MAG: DUF368 domain-containing protein [Zetaproteobacteria bacterium]|nr:DUF368 domain-containing protein [Zetaproteobacteria bacterium]
MSKKGSPSLMQMLELYLKGMCMGAADVIPGVSGGTVAFITGIYDELLLAIKSFTPLALWKVFRQPLRTTLAVHHVFFLLPLGAGVASSILLLAGLMNYLLGAYPEMVWSFFFGLIAASGLLLNYENGRITFDDFICILVGAAAAVWLAKLVPAQLASTPWTTFMAGFISIIAMILPGISGAFILVLMGMYSSIILALKSFDLHTIFLFGTGAALGLSLFSRVLSWLLDRYAKVTVSTLIGFMYGSLYKVWPWKVTEAYILDHHEKVIPTVQKNVTPWNYFAMTGQEPFLLPSVMLMVAAVVVVAGIHLWGKRARLHQASAEHV